MMLAVATIADSAGRGFRAEFHDPVGADQGHVVRSVIGVMDQSVEVPPAPHAAMSRACNGRMSAFRGGGNVPTHDAAGVHVGDERDVCEPGPGAHIGDVRDPEPPRPVGGEPAVHEIRRRLRAGSCCVVNTFFDRFTPRTPARRISRPV